MTLDNVKLHLVNSIESVAKLHNWLSSKDTNEVLGIDTETSGLSFRHDILRMVQLGDRENGWAIPWERWGGVFEDAIKHWSGPFVLHNAKFDIRFLNNHKMEIPIHRIRDTRIAAHILDPVKSNSLKNISARLVDSRAAAGQKILQEAMDNGGWDWGSVPINFQPYWTYAALDPVETRHVHDIVYPEVMLEAPDAYNLEIGVSWIIDRMERRGILVDTKYAKDKQQVFLNYCKQVEDWCKSEYNIKPGTNKEVVRILEEDGWKFIKKTATGAVALDREILSAINHPLAQAVLQRRRFQKLSSAYLKHFIEECDSDNLIWPSINSLGHSRDENDRDGKGIRTGRMSIASPPLQGLPRKNEDNPAAVAVRNCIVARPGHTLLMCDFDQIEMRVLAHASADSSMINSFGQGDFFINLARLIYDDDSISRKDDPRRQITKSAGYATVYGAGPTKFSATAGVTEEEAEAFFKKFHDLAPGVKRFQREIESMARRTKHEENIAYIRSPLTNRKQIADDYREHALVNYFIQGLAGEIFKTKILELDAAGLGDWMILPVHDEIVLDVPNNQVLDAVDILQKIMNDTKLLRVPITAGVSFGARWGSKKDWDYELWKQNAFV